MKTTMLGLAATTMMFLFASMAQADDRDGNSGWRLGERNRDGYAIYRRDRGNWHRVPGSAVAVGEGWVLGSKRESGGYAIYRWNGYGWDQAPGGAVQIGGSYNRPWVVNNRGQRFSWNGYDWSASGYAGNPRYSDRDRHRGNTFGRDFNKRGNGFGRDFDRRHRDRDFRDRGRRDRNRWFDRRHREWDPYRYDERRRFGKRDFWRRR